MNERQRLRAWVAVSSERFAALIPAPSLAAMPAVDPKLPMANRRFAASGSSADD
jgi:hypothetical protein